MRIQIPTSYGVSNVTAFLTPAPGIVIHKSPSGDERWGVTHQVTGFAFFNHVPDKELARRLAVILGGMANWNVRSVEATHEIFKSLPKECKRWILDGQESTWNRPSGATPEQITAAIRRVRNVASRCRRRA